MREKTLKTATNKHLTRLTTIPFLKFGAKIGREGVKSRIEEKEKQ
jgi:hypothetical protein